MVDPKFVIIGLAFVRRSPVVRCPSAIIRNRLFCVACLRLTLFCVVFLANRLKFVRAIWFLVFRKRTNLDWFVVFVLDLLVLFHCRRSLCFCFFVLFSVCSLVCFFQ